MNTLLPSPSAVPALQRLSSSAHDSLRKGAVALAAALLPLLAAAQTSEEQAKEAAQEVKLLVTEGTAVIGDLQPMINSGKVNAADVSPDALTLKLKARYQAAAGKPLDSKAPGLVGDTRRAYEKAFVDTLTRSQPNLVKGGQDAFVPAHFRAQVLKDFNKSMQGKVQAYATNRAGELINTDWDVRSVMKGSSNVDEVHQLMGTGSLDPVVKRTGSTYLGYWPMKLGAACVACHAQNGLKQQEGKFGGALVAEIPVK